MAVCTQPAEVHAGYRLRLCQPAGVPGQPEEGEEAGAPAASGSGPTPAAVLAAVRPALEQAWAAALDAATSVLAEQPVAEAAAGEPQYAALQEQHAVLLDIGQLAVSRAAEAAMAAAAGQPAGGGPAAELGEALSALGAALAAIRRLTAPQFVAAGWLPAELGAELAALLLGLLESTLLPLSASQAAAGAAQGQVASLAAAAAAVLRQLPVSPSLQEQVVAAARAVLRLAAGGPADDASGTLATADALAAVGRQLQAAAAAGSQAGFVRCLHQALQLGVDATCSSQRQQELAAAAAFLSDAAAAAYQQQQQPGGMTTADRDLPTADDVLAAAVQTLAQHARHCAGANGTAAAAGSKGQQLEAALTSMLALGGALQPPAATSSSQAACADSALAGAAAPPEAVPAAASSADDWDDDPFGDGAAQEGAAAPQPAELQPQAGAAAEAATETEAGPPAAAAAEAAEAAAAADEHEWDEDSFAQGSAGSAPAGQAQASADDAVASTSTAQAAAAQAAEHGAFPAEEEDDWGDDPFATSPATAQPAEAGAALAALSLAEASSSSPSAAARQLVIELLRELVGGGSSAPVQQHALAALRTHLQAQQQRGAAEQQRSWALACAAAALPGAAARVRELMGGSGAQGDVDTQVGGSQGIAGQAVPTAPLALRLSCTTSPRACTMPSRHFLTIVPAFNASGSLATPRRPCTTGGGGGSEGRTPGSQPCRGGHPQRASCAAPPVCAHAG